MSFRVSLGMFGPELARIQSLLKVLPKSLKNGAMRTAGRKAADVVRKTIRPLVPKSKRNYRVYGPFQSKSKQTGGYLHLRDGIISKVKTYRTAIVVLVGPKTRAGLNHAHLIEEGTRERFWRHSTKSSSYVTIGHKRIKRRINGRRVFINKAIKRSTGSTLDVEKLKKGAVRSTGRGRPYKFMERGWSIAEPRVLQVITAELSAALAKVSGGHP